jgi:hypothetical protein
MKAKQKTSDRLTLDEAQLETEREIPEILDSITVNGTWLWYCGEPLSGEVHRGTRERMKAMGWRFCPKGKHGTWFYWTKVPPKRGFGSKGKASSGKRKSKASRVRAAERGEPVDSREIAHLLEAF